MKHGLHVLELIRRKCLAAKVCSEVTQDKYPSKKTITRVIVTMLVIVAMCLYIGSVAKAATAQNDLPRWTHKGSKYIINVCFWGNGTANDKWRIEKALSNTWAAFSNIHFIFHEDCNNHLESHLVYDPITGLCEKDENTGRCIVKEEVDKEWIPIKLDFSASGNTGGGTAGGKGGRYNDDPQVQIKLVYNNSRENFEALAVHEVGHALTLIHEHGRSDWPGRAIGVWDNPTMCVGNWNNPAQNTHRDAWHCDRRNNDDSVFNDPRGYTNCCCSVYHPEQKNVFAVLPVDPASIMSPWNCDPNRRALTPPSSNFPNYWELSYYDALGIEIIYPYSAVRSIRGRNGFVTQDGIVVRSDDRLVSDWHFRGALTSLYKTTPVWGYNGVTSTKNEINVTDFSTFGTYNISIRFQDVFSRSQSGRTLVDVNDAKHTALIIANLGI